MHQRRSVSNRFFRVKYCRQLIVLDVNQGEGLFRRILIDSGHRCDRLAHIAHFIDCKNMLVLNGVAITARGHVFGGNDRLHAAAFLCLFDVHAQNFTVRYRTS